MDFPAEIYACGIHEVGIDKDLPFHSPSFVDKASFSL
jgi:hypothetical protein